MNRRKFLSFIAASPAVAAVPSAGAVEGGWVTYVDPPTMKYIQSLVGVAAMPQPYRSLIIKGRP